LVASSSALHALPSQARPAQEVTVSDANPDKSGRPDESANAAPSTPASSPDELLKDLDVNVFGRGREQSHRRQGVLRMDKRLTDAHHMRT
jgi:hypothetical protein